MEKKGSHKLSKTKKDKEDIFSSYTKQLRIDKKLLKFYSQNILAFINLNTEHKKSLLKLIDDIDKYSFKEHQIFIFLKDFQIIINLQYNYIKDILDKNEKIFENLKKSIDANLLMIKQFLSNMENIEENMKIKSEFIHGQNNFIFKSFQAIENEIVEDYFKNKYNIKLKKNKEKDKNKNKDSKTHKEKLIDECNKIEKDFSFLSNEISNLIKKYIQKYNSEILEIKSKMIDFYKSTKNNLINIIKNIKEIHNNSIIKEEKNIQSLENNNIINNEFKSEFKDYLNLAITEKELSYLLEIKKYKIQIIDKNEIRLNKLFNFKENKDIPSIIINCKDIYNIVEEIYKYNFKLIDKAIYVLDIEKIKIDIIEQIGKLFGYDFFSFTKSKIEIFSEEELNNFINIIFSNEEYVILFLSYLNNYRTKGRFKIIEEQFNILKVILSKICDYLLDNNNSNIYTSVIILSQTFYMIINGKNYYLQNEIKNKKFFTQKEFWKNFLVNKINDEINIFEQETSHMNLKEETKKLKIEEIILTKLISLIPSFTGFDLSKESINDILLFLIDKFNIDEEKRKKIFSFVDIE